MLTKEKHVEKFDFITNYIAPNIRKQLLRLDEQTKTNVQEIRLRANGPIMLSMGKRNNKISDRFEKTDESAYLVSKEDIHTTFEFICSSSIHSVIDELKNGFVTISGGHRVGVCGKAVIKDGAFYTMKDISSINFRIAKEFIGCADGITDQIIDSNKIKNTLIISPPSCGKTTMLRDLARQLSNGIPRLGFPGVRVGVVDERSEICGVFRGMAQNDVGIQTDILDACPKAYGIMLMLRCMSPQVIITDELGLGEDIDAIRSANNTGVGVIASVHGDSITEVAKKKLFKPLFDDHIFDIAVLLDNKRGIGNIAQISQLSKAGVFV